jgi:hypothetical protein
MTERKQSGKRDRGSTLARDSRERTRSLFLRTQSLYASMAAGSGVGDDYAGSAATASPPRRSCGRGRKNGSWRRRWGRCPWDRGQMRTESPRGGRGGGGGGGRVGRIGALSRRCDLWRRQIGKLVSLTGGAACEADWIWRSVSPCEFSGFNF